MNRRLSWLAAGSVALMLGACGGGGGGVAVPTPTPEPAPAEVTVEDLPAGSYTMSLGDADAPTVGKYYAATDGSRLLAVRDSDDATETIYRRNAAGTWTAAPPATQDVNLRLLRSDRLPDAATVPIEALAGRYVAAAGAEALFSITADGRIVAGNSACRISGQLQPGTAPGTLRLRLSTSGCDAWPAQATGVLVVDADDAPARLRLVADDGTRVLDLWGYAQP